jgi:hypothetical protein
VICEVIEDNLQDQDYLINRFGLDGRLLVGNVNDTRGTEIGRQGAELVLRLIDGPQLAPGQVLIKPEVFNERLSCSAPPQI